MALFSKNTLTQVSGFDNQIIELVGRELGLNVEYVLFRQRKGFFRQTLSAGLCDVVIGRFCLLA